MNSLGKCRGVALDNLVKNLSLKGQRLNNFEDLILVSSNMIF